MTIRPKIKIQDISELRKILNEKQEAATHVQLCEYSLLLAKHILKVASYEDSNNPILQLGFTTNESWQIGQARVYDIRQSGFQIHKLAKQCQHAPTQAALRVAGHAVGVAHMRQHAMVASDYAIRVMNLLYPNDYEEVLQERKWQIDCLDRIVKESLKD